MNKVEINKSELEVLELKARVLDMADDRAKIFEDLRNKETFLSQIASKIFDDLEDKEVTFETISNEIDRLVAISKEVNNSNVVDGEFEEV